ncbi:glycosyltransferase family 2 protein [Cellulomonas telluris]|uniref:glycosyltransferase family 2 protein n=1 Tax=Cellulomonas telluris TaxID=2306636 RepID=UPI0010A81798|nr:glycosyltransferase family 2 protein [Cellulomonas telluris]
MLVDLVVPYWGDPEYLRETVASVLAQSDPRWRLTVVDDCYPDAWAGDYLRGLGDPRVHYVRNEVNRGIAAVFQQCVDLATAEVVAMPGCDDVLLPDYVAVVLSAFERFEHVDVVQPGVRVVDERGRRVRPLVDEVKQRVVRPRASEPRVLSGEPLAVSLLHGDWLYWPSLAFRRESVQAVRFRTDLPIALDLALVLDLVRAGAQLLLEPTECFAYRRHVASASSEAASGGGRFGDERDFFEEAARDVEQLGWRRAARAARLHVTSRAHALTLLPRAVARRDAAAARALLRHAVRP